MDVVIGMDLSLRGPAFVALSLKRLMVLKWGFMTDIKHHYESDVVVGGRKGMRFLLRKKQKKTKKLEADQLDQYISYRNWYIQLCISQFLLSCKELCSHTHLTVAIEGYAYGRVSGKECLAAFQIGESIGIVKELLYTSRIPYRIYQPNTIKTFATGNKSAKKFQMVARAQELGLNDVVCYCDPGNKFDTPLSVDGRIHHRDDKGPGTDLADAFHIARMLREELLLKCGLVTLDNAIRSDLFKSSSKANPIPLVDRPFVCGRSCDVK